MYSIIIHDADFLDYLENISEKNWEAIEKEYPRCNNLYKETGDFLDFLRGHLSENDYN